MTVKKRGLGRGLEALLVDVASKEDMHQPQTMKPADYQPVKGAIQSMPAPVSGSMDAGTATQGKEEKESRQEQGASATQEAVSEQVDDRAAMVVALFKNIQREHLVLLEEAEALRKLIEEFEAIIRADLA